MRFYLTHNKSYIILVQIHVTRHPLQKVSRKLRNPSVWRMTASRLRHAELWPRRELSGSSTDNVRGAYEQLFDNIDMGLPSATDSGRLSAGMVCTPRHTQTYEQSFHIAQPTLD